jgi:isoleucyl-tRNA synthetase
VPGQYRDTLNLPHTEFPMRAGLSEAEPARLRQWHDEQLYARLRQARRGRRRFVLHDGPPYANGDIHIGTALNKILKDIVNRAHWMEGEDVAYVPGYDTHGLPIEHLALAQMGVDRHRESPLEVRRISRDFALRHIESMNRQFMRFGVLGDWQAPYVTLSPDYEAAEVRVFGSLYARGLVTRGLRSVLWCPNCETALADAEIEYGPEESPSLYVAFPMVDPGPLPAGSRAVIWTTTAWTLPADEAVALHPDLPYEAVPTTAGPLLLAAARADAALAEMGLRRQGDGPRFAGRDLEGLRARPPFGDRDVPLILGDHVTAEDGSGLVHTAPGHGAEDFEVGRRYGLPVRVAVDHAGRMTAEAGAFAGLGWTEAEGPIVRALRDAGRLLHAGRITHEYPHCWRCKGPVLFRATEQWFCSIDPLREPLARAVREVAWNPAWGGERMAQMLAARDDWCISRQRAWGLPIPVLWCASCHRPVCTERTIDHIAELFRREGSDAWFSGPSDRLWPEDFACPHCGARQGFAPDPDTLDVWFDSGSSHAAVLGTEDLPWPADLYLEGSDQFRGWFNSSLTTAVAQTGHAPYRAVLCHGFVVDGEGRKMSKSLGNGIDAAEAVERRGADVIRLWTTSVDFTADLRLSEPILDQVADAYRKLRNTLRFLLGAVSDYDAGQAPPPSALRAVDRYALRRHLEVVGEIRRAYRDLKLHAVYQAVYAYAVVDLSAFYLDILKDRLYTYRAHDPQRRAAQAVLRRILVDLLRALAPLVPFTADEAYGHLPRPADWPDRLVLTSWQDTPEGWPAGVAPPDLAAWAELLRLREAVLGALERARREGVVGASAEARLDLALPPAAAAAVRALTPAEREELFQVSEVTVSDGDGAPVVRVSRAEGGRCARCRVVRREVMEAGPAGSDLCDRCRAIVREAAVAAPE